MQSESAVTKALKAKEQADFDQVRKIGKLMTKAIRKSQPKKNIINLNEKRGCNAPKDLNQNA